MSQSGLKDVLYNSVNSTEQNLFDEKKEDFAKTCFTCAKMNN